MTEQTEEEAFPKDHWIWAVGWIYLPCGEYKVTIYKNETGGYGILLSQNGVGIEIFSPYKTQEEIVSWIHGYEYGRDEAKGRAVMKLKEALNEILSQ